MDLIEKSFSTFEDKDYIFTEEYRQGLKYREINRAASNVAHLLLKEGLNADHKVAILMQNDLNCLITLFAIMKVAAIPILLNPKSKVTEIRKILEDATADYLMVCKGEEDNIVENLEYGLEILEIPSYEEVIEYNGEYLFFPEREEDDIAVVLYTSGSTGKPKGVMLKYHGWVDSAIPFGEMCHIKAHHRLFQFMPLYHGTGWFTTFIAPVVFGASVVIGELHGTTKIMNFWSNVEKFEANYLILIPSVMSVLLMQAKIKKGKYPRIEYVNSSSAPLLPSLRREFEDFFDTNIVEDFSSTEAGILSITYPRMENSSVGKLANISELKIDDNGEILVKNQKMFGGYMNNKGLTEKSYDGEWYRTGDYGKVEGELLYILGRMDDVINRNGIKVSPIEIDNVLNGCVFLKESYTFGYKSLDNNEQCFTAVVKNDGGILDKNRILEFLKQNLSAEKIPNKFFEVDAIPKNKVGKPSKLDLIKKIKQEYHI